MSACVKLKLMPMAQVIHLSRSLLPPSDFYNGVRNCMDLCQITPRTLHVRKLSGNLNIPGTFGLQGNQCQIPIF